MFTDLPFCNPNAINKLFLLTLWLVLNTICNFFNRILFHHLGWHFPVLLTLIHGVASMAFYLFLLVRKLFLAFLYLSYQSILLSNRSTLISSYSFQFIQGLKLQKFETVRPKFFLNYIVPIAVFGCATTILNNEGLDIIDVATVQLVKSTTPIFIALIAWFAFGKREPLIVYPLFTLTTIGVTIAVYDQLGEQFSTLGLMLALGSAITRAIASILSEYLMKNSDPSTKSQTLDPMSLVFYSNPVEILMLLPMFLGLELKIWDERNLISEQNISSSMIAFFIFLDCCAVFALRYVTNLALKNTSAISISVFAQVKFVASIVISVLYFGYSLPLYRFIGLLFVVIGTFLYGLVQNNTKQRKKLDTTC